MTRNPRRIPNTSAFIAASCRVSTFFGHDTEFPLGKRPVDAIIGKAVRQGQVHVQQDRAAPEPDLRLAGQEAICGKGHDTVADRGWGRGG